MNTDIKQGYNILKTCLYLNLVNILFAKIIKALKIVNRNIAFDSFCLWLMTKNCIIFV